MLNDKYFKLSREREAYMAMHKVTKQMGHDALEGGLTDAAYIYLTMAESVWTKYCEVADQLDAFEETEGE